MTTIYLLRNDSLYGSLSICPMIRLDNVKNWGVWMADKFSWRVRQSHGVLLELLSEFRNGKDPIVFISLPPNF